MPGCCLDVKRPKATSRSCRTTQVKPLLLATGLAVAAEARLHFVGRPPTFQSHAWPSTARAVSPSQPDLEESDLHVISLRKPRDAVRACPVRSYWTWKEKVLGDGHDFFIPRPRTTRRLASVFRSMPGADVEALSQKPEFEMPNCIPAIQHVMTTAVELRKTFADASVKL
ncbi:hypothetical protein AK812_SmicGene10968 [Symbiodinium microadriaticum]|uniref:Uncharacterized protein n=1 Tax=Symbiodinium microadriaticum TaxID=2951 RepID=A0A1Q9EEC4_SYMMI|nr:hypothetical protein AK812_SmicGene10968 [Symbiodinium microadriaticum]